MPYIFKVMINDCKKGCDIQDVNAVAGEPRLYGIWQIGVLKK